MVLFKCKRVNFHSLLELNEGQHLFEWKNTPKRVKDDFFRQYSSLLRVKIKLHIRFRMKIFHSKRGCPSFNSLHSFSSEFPLFQLVLHLESTVIISPFWHFCIFQN